MWRTFFGDRPTPPSGRRPMSARSPILDRPTNFIEGEIDVDDDTTLSAVDLLEINRDIQGSPTIRLLAALNLGGYATLMERHLNEGVISETELVVRLERDLDDLGRPGGEQSGLGLIKSWASQGWLHRVADQRTEIEHNFY